MHANLRDFLEESRSEAQAIILNLTLIWRPSAHEGRGAGGDSP